MLDHCSLLPPHIVIENSCCIYRLRVCSPLPVLPETLQPKGICRTSKRKKMPEEDSQVAGPSSSREPSADLLSESQNEEMPVKRRILSTAKPKKSNKPTPGIIYISRLPPGMTPQKVKHLMSSYGDIGRVYAQRKDGEYFVFNSAWLPM